VITTETNNVRPVVDAPVTASRAAVTIATPVAVPKTVVEVKPAFGAIDFAAAFAAALAEADGEQMTLENTDAIVANDVTHAAAAVEVAREIGTRDMSDADATIVAEADAAAGMHQTSNTELDLLAMLETGVAANVRNTLAAGAGSKGKGKSKDKRMSEQAPDMTGGVSRKLF
jgi:hypothetical protein